MSILKLSDVSYRYTEKTAVLYNLNAAFECGRMYVIFGPSGCGKTTLLSLIGGLDSPTGGSIWLNGENFLLMKEQQRTVFRRRNIGFVFQSFQLIPELNVEQNIIFPLLLDGKKPEKGAVDEILDTLGLTERRKHLPGQLSGGQQQRAAIGRALITKPILILADEPTGNLDSENSRDVMELLASASRKYSQTILMITHNTALTSYAERIFHVTDGHLADLGGKRNEKLS